jgi:shikimate dehydrogenase
MDQGRELMKLALFGSPVKSSLSPRIHTLFAQQAGLDIEYQCIEVQTEDFPGALEAFRLAGGTGCNVTLPLKRDAWQLASQSSKAVSQAQAANTLVLQSSGWFAHNTDGAGLVADLTGNNGVELENQRILIIGAGGATAGILGDLLACNPREIMLVNRSPDRAWALVKRFSSVGHLSVTPLQDLPCLDLLEHGKFNLVINATSVGHQGEAPPLTRELFARDAICYDLNYFKASQPLKMYCQELRKPYIDGLGMLVEQAAKSFYLWTGYTPQTQSVIENCRQTKPA